jgi:chromosome segregation ATPase
MKQYLPAVLALTCVVLGITLFMMKHSDDAQHQTDVTTIGDFSNQLDSAQLQIANYRGAIITLSNRLDECRLASVTFSNNLMEAEAVVVAKNMEQITNLNEQLAAVQSENQTLGQQITDLTNQIAGLTNQIALTDANLMDANKKNVLLDHCLRQDVAERVVVERKFNNPAELQAQLKNLKKNPAREVTAQSIYAGLNVEVTSNGFHVVSPN